jgi:hypothetical protein
MNNQTPEPKEWVIRLSENSCSVQLPKGISLQDPRAHACEVMALTLFYLLHHPQKMAELAEMLEEIMDDILED